MKEDARAVWVPGWIDQLRQDTRYGVRLLRRQPGFAAVAILTMALGIGATTMLFSVAYGVLLKPLPWSDADRLVRVTETRQGRTGRVLGTVSNGTFLAWRDHPTAIEDLGGWLTQTGTLTGAGDPVRVPIIPTTPSLFAILRVRPLIGRLFNEGEGARGQPGLVILSYGLWQERFGRRPEIVGQQPSGHCSTIKGQIRLVNAAALRKPTKLGVGRATSERDSPARRRSATCSRATSPAERERCHTVKPCANSSS